MSGKYHVKLGKIIDGFKLEILYGPEGFQDRAIHTEDINRAGMQLTGFFDYFEPKRVQIIGRVEQTYLEQMDSNSRLERFYQLMSTDIPALIISREMDVFPECLEAAQKYGIPVLRTADSTSGFMSSLISHLKVEMAPRITRHGVLVEVYGEGVLLLGESGVGKSETAIELVKRGHRLIADDAVEIRKVTDRKIIGTAPELIKHYIELRGIGVVDVRRLFGMSAVKEEQEIDVVISLEQWKQDAVYDRLGADNLYTTILGVDVASLTVPVKPGRNLAVIIEVAAMNNRHKKMGYNAALEFTNQINAHFEQLSNGV